jgi:hypothetical protein
VKRIDQLKQQREDLDKRIRELAAQDQKAERKRDERRKVILGGWLIKHRADLVQKIIENGLEREQDKAAFEGWTPPAATAQSTPAPETTGAPTQEG